MPPCGDVEFAYRYEGGGDNGEIGEDTSDSRMIWLGGVGDLLLAGGVRIDRGERAPEIFRYQHLAMHQSR